MQPRIETCPRKLLVGKNITTSLAADRTGELWRSFMPLRSQVTNAVGTDLFSVQIFPEGYFAGFNPQMEFIKWASVEVSIHDNVPPGMECMIIPEGLYAVFFHKGGPLTAHKIIPYIFQEWLPASPFKLDHRPHFEILGKNYRNNDMDSEEDMFIPVAPR
jgi:AraC family transcriptional regulator